MENVLAAVTGLATFLVMFLCKIPIKKFSRRRSGMGNRTGRERYAAYRRWNLGIIAAVFLISAAAYYAACRLGGIHHKLCCSFKAGVIALALYAVYDQFFGRESFPDDF